MLEVVFLPVVSFVITNWPLSHNAMKTRLSAVAFSPILVLAPSMAELNHTFVDDMCYTKAAASRVGDLDEGEEEL